jgi:hypothetical protein
MFRTSDCSRWIAKCNGLGQRIWLSDPSIEDVPALVLNMSLKLLQEYRLRRVRGKLWRYLRGYNCAKRLVKYQFGTVGYLLLPALEENSKGGFQALRF